MVSGQSGKYPFFNLSSNLPFNSEGIKAASSANALQRLWEAYEVLEKLPVVEGVETTDAELNEKVVRLVNDLEEFMDDDFSTAKVLANMFELVPIINSVKDGHIPQGAISAGTLKLLRNSFKIYLEDILGLKNSIAGDESALDGVMQLLIDIRKEAKVKKDYATSDKIRNQLSALGIALKDEKDGNTSWST